MSYSSFSVPTLSLSGSRARRNFGPPPTSDNPHLSSQPYESQNKTVPYPPNLTDKYRKNAIFPPRGPSSTYEASNVEVSSKELNKNVYLRRQEQEENQLENANRLSHPPKEGASRSRESFQGGISAEAVEEAWKERTLTRKAEISRVMFERKLSKLMEEAKFYDEELTGSGKDEMGSHLSELESLKESSLEHHKSLLDGLSSLIA